MSTLKSNCKWFLLNLATGTMVLCLASMSSKSTTVSPTPVTIDRLLRGGEVAAALNISRALAFRWMQSGVLPVVRVPGARTVRVPQRELERWIREHTCFKTQAKEDCGTVPEQPAGTNGGMDNCGIR
jgi:excisionase family DNA binding protein